MFSPKSPTVIKTPCVGPLKRDMFDVIQRLEASLTVSVLNRLNCGSVGPYVDPGPPRGTQPSAACLTSAQTQRVAHADKYSVGL